VDKKILILSQDVGGANYIAPSIDYIVNRFPSLIVVHSLSEQTFKKRKISFYPLSHFFEYIPPREEEIKSFLLQNKISHLYCTTSSSRRDLTNSNFIKISRKLNIPTFGIMDHWKGFDRFQDENQELSYFPDFIGCIDELCKEKLIRLRNNPERIFVIGHPHLEEFVNNRTTYSESNKTVNVLVVSQPDTKDRSFNSIFMKKIGAETIIEKVIKQIGQVGKGVNINVNYRAHPKEHASLRLPDSINSARNDEEDGALYENDIFIGFDSMLLVEADLAGKHCISLNIPEFSGYNNMAIPYKVWEEVETMDNLGNTMKKLVETIRKGCSKNPSKLEDTVRGSLDRLIYYFEVFVKEGEQGHVF
jgi:hypothetical protein